MTDETKPVLDPKALKLASYRVFQTKEAEMLAVMIQLGNRLGLFVALDGHPRTASELADVTGLQARWIAEWLYAVTSGQLLNKEGDRFVLSPEMAVVIAREGVPGFVGTMFNAPVTPEVVDRLCEAFRTGLGFSWDDHGESTCHMQAEMSGGRDTHFLVDEVLSAIPDLVAQLESGIRVADLGCGAGGAVLAMAEAFPRSTFLGMDPSGHAIKRAKSEAAARRLENVEFRLGVFEDLEPDSLDFLLVIDVLHDLPHPVGAVKAAKEAVVDGGLWLVADVRAEEAFEDNLKMPLLSMFYSMSVIYCMNSSLSEEGGAGLGVMGLHPERLRGWTESAGFSSLVIHEFDHDLTNRYFEVRP